MAVYKNVENIRKLFDNEYKSTRKLINEGETHIDNLAEGFSEATRVLDMLPTEDVVPRSEVEKAKQEVEDLKCQLEKEREYIEFLKVNIVSGKQEVAKQIFEEIEQAISNMEYKANTPRKTVKVEELKEQVDWVLHQVVPQRIAELKKKYIGE